MQFVKKDGVNLAYKERNPGARPILFVHGWGCDHTFFAPQEQFFSRSHHVISVDLRGHGKSDTPEQEYTETSLGDRLSQTADLLLHFFTKTRWRRTFHIVR